MMKKVKKVDAQYLMEQQALEQKNAQKYGTNLHSPVSVYGSSPKGNMSTSTYSAQLTEYQKDAAKLSSDAQRIQFWLKKAGKKDDGIKNEVVPALLHNRLLEKRTYLRQAIALGSVEAALQQDQLIKIAVEKKCYNLLGSEFNLSNPIIAAAVRISPLISLYINQNTSEEEKVALNEAMIAAFPTDPSSRMSVMKIILQDETDTKARNEVAKYVLALPKPGQQSICTAAYNPTSSSSSSSSGPSYNNLKPLNNN